METVFIQIEARLRDHLLAVEFSMGNELVALLGRDGAGKTEILRSIAGVYTPDQGVIEIQDKPVFNTAQALNEPPSKRHTGWVAHVSSLFPGQTVHDNIAFPLRKYRLLSDDDARRRMDEILDLMSLESVRDTTLSELDVRLQHTVALARALVLDPDVLLLDQPYKELDVASQRTIRRDFQAVRQMVGVPALVATTDMEEAYDIADRIALLDRGRLLQIDPPKTLVNRPKNRLVADLVRAVNVFPATVVEQIDGGVIVDTALGSLEALHPWVSTASVEIVIRPEHIRLLAPAESATGETNVLTGDILDVTDYGDICSAIFRPRGVHPDAVLEISMSNLMYDQLGLDQREDRTVVLPGYAIHIMDPIGEGTE